MECLIRDYNERLGEPTSPGKGAPGLDRVKFRSILQNTFGISDDIMMDRGTVGPSTLISMLCVCHKCRNDTFYIWITSSRLDVIGIDNLELF